MWRSFASFAIDTPSPISSVGKDCALILTSGSDRQLPGMCSVMVPSGWSESCV